jgi:hypothetical protein
MFPAPLSHCPHFSGFRSEAADPGMKKVVSQRSLV